MDGDELVEVATSFRSGILDGRPSYRACAMVSLPLASYLNCLGIKCDAVTGEIDECGLVDHCWIRLSDGRVLDPTADQFERGYPPIYLGPPLDIHTNKITGRSD